MYKFFFSIFSILPIRLAYSCTVAPPEQNVPFLQLINRTNRIALGILEESKRLPDGRTQYLFKTVKVIKGEVGEKFEFVASDGGLTIEQAYKWISRYNSKTKKYGTRGYYLALDIAKKIDDEEKIKQQEKYLAGIKKEFESFLKEFPVATYPIDLKNYAKKKIKGPFSNFSFYHLVSRGGDLFAKELNKPI